MSDSAVVALTACKPPSAPNHMQKILLYLNLLAKFTLYKMFCHTL